MSESLSPSLRNHILRLVLLAVLVAPAAETRSPLSTKERAEVFEEVWSTIQDKYYDPAFNGVDWNAVRLEYRPRLDSVTNDQDFYLLLGRMVAELHDAHTRFRSPRQRQEREQRVATSTGIIIREIEGVPVVVEVTPGSDAARAGVVAGMIVREVDGRPFPERLAEVSREIEPGSSERHTRLIAYARVLGGKPDTSLALELARADGSLFEVALLRRTVPATPQFSSLLLPSGFVYIRFDRFRFPVGKQVRTVLEEHKHAPGLILDLRLNGGGDAQEMLRIAELFFNREVPVGRLLTRTGKPPSFFLGLVRLPIEISVGREGGQVYGGPLVVLTSEATGSSSETLVNLLQEHQRATILGTQTCGCALGVLRHRKVQGGGELDISEIGLLSAKGRRIEGAGITPDKILTPTILDLQRQRDVPLEEAQKILAHSES
ncbi:MAG: carboxyl-terminal processing protease [Acidobacteriota bacterium]|jgi:carboxyl-terminal processing protease|nr:carboxyl-terminal processing protease [Acidobacteriota bacterium]